MEYNNENANELLYCSKADVMRKSPLDRFNNALTINYKLDKCLKLLDKLPNLNVLDENGRTPLILIAMNDRVALMLEMIYRPGVNINAYDLEFKTALHYAIYHKHLDITEMLLNHPSIDVTIKDHEGKTALHYMAAFNSLPSCRELLFNQCNFDINVQDEKGYSALHYACICNMKYMATKILERGIDIELRDKRRRTAIFLLCMHNKRFNINSLLGRLLKYKANINIQDDKGKTPLHFMCKVNDNTLIRVLYEYNNSININEKDIDGRMPIHYAAMNKTNKVLEQLIEYGALINEFDCDGYSPIMYAFKASAVDCVKLLLECGAIVNYSHASVRRFHDFNKLNILAPAFDYMKMLALHMFDNIFFIRVHYLTWPIEYRPYLRYFNELNRIRKFSLFNTPYTMYDLLIATKQDAMEYLQYTEFGDQYKFYEEFEREFQIYGKDCMEKLRSTIMALTYFNSK